MLVHMARKKVRKVPDCVHARDRYFAAVLEDLNGKFSLLLEGYGMLDASVGKLEESIENAAHEMECLGQRMNKMEQGMGDLEAKFETLRIEANEKFAVLFEGQQEFFEEVRHVNLRITALEGGF